MVQKMSPNWLPWPRGDKRPPGRTMARIAPNGSNRLSLGDASLACVSAIPLPFGAGFVTIFLPLQWCNFSCCVAAAKSSSISFIRCKFSFHWLWHCHWILPLSSGIEGYCGFFELVCEKGSYHMNHRNYAARPSLKLILTGYFASTNIYF